jgi:hypothetical protein
MAFLPILFRPCAKATEVVVFPLPLLLGVVAVTKIKLPLATFASSMVKFTLALYLPYCSICSASIPIDDAIFWMF